MGSRDPWYETSFGCEYLELYAHRDEAEARSDIQGIIRLLSPPKDEPLLDLCCGACRHLFVLREMGFTELVGLDLSEELLQVASAGLSGTESASSRVQLVRSDMRDIPYENHFATVLSLFTSFGYFERDQENQAVFHAVHKALRPGGRFLIDYLSRDYVIANLVASDEKALPDRHIENVRCLTDDCQRVQKTTTVTAASGMKRQFHESVRMYSQAEMVHMLEAASLAHRHSYGSLDGQPFHAQSNRLIIVAEKEA